MSVPAGGSDDLAEAAERGDVVAIARWFAECDLTMVEMPEDSDEEGRAALTAEVDDDPMLVAFTSQSQASVFADSMPELLSHGKLPAFVVHGLAFLANLPKGFGVLLDPESDDSLLLPPELMEDVKAFVRQRHAAELASVEIDVPPERLQLTPFQEQVFEWLETHGFRPARWLPPPDMNQTLRPAEEIAGRLMAMAAVFSWVTAPKEAVPAATLSTFMQVNRLRRFLTDEEAAILTQPRAEARKTHQDSIGWKLENMWPLAWILGFEPEPTIEASQIHHEVSRAIVFEFLPGFEGTVADLVQRAQLRPAVDVIGLEYHFYCAHNAVRSAQRGEDTVPSGFHPIVHGGAVHERRHALTWSLSPGVSWDETDLST